VFVADVSRAGRSLRDFLELLEACRNHDTLLIVDGRILDFKDSRDRLIARSSLTSPSTTVTHDVRC